MLDFESAYLTLRSLDLESLNPSGLKSLMTRNAAASMRMAAIATGTWSKSSVALSDIAPKMRASFTGDWGKEPLVEVSDLDHSFLRITIKQRQFLVEAATDDGILSIYKEWEGTTDE